MKKLILMFFVAMFCVSANADTIGPYEVKLKQKVMVTMLLNYPVHLTLDADSITDSDTLEISRANCPGSERPVRYAVLVLDSTRIYKQDEFHSRHTEFIPYKIPLTKIISQYKLTGRKEFQVELYTDKLANEKIMGTLIIHIE